MIEVHYLKLSSSGSDSEDSEEEHEDILSRDREVLNLMMTNNYPDAEIDKLLETFKLSGGTNDILNGEYIENDIRMSEAIREAIEEIKFA